MPGALYRPGGKPLRRRPWGADDTTGPVGGRPLPPALIPFSWIAPTLYRKPDTPLTIAKITQADGITATSRATQAVRNQYGANTATITLDTACDADPQNLADFITTYRSTPRPRQPTLTLNLLDRTDDECLTVLDVGLGRRVRIINAPSTTPPGALNFTVQGISHQIGVEVRTVTWTTAAVVGTSATEPGPWFRLGTSALGGSDLRPF